MQRPTFLLIPVIGLAGCGSCGLDTDAQTRCAVELGGPTPLLEIGADRTLDDLNGPGPHPSWSTQPHPSCNHNPRLVSTSTGDEVELLISYPAASDPMESGYGDVAAGQWPVILFAHANSYADCRLVDAYSSLQDRWASWGFIVVSVDASHLCEKNSQSNLEGRRDDLMAAWGSLESMARDPDNPLHGRVDSESLILAGHSRGATAALLASTWLPEADGLIWLQGVDTAGYHLGHPRVDVPALGVVAGKDRDIRFPKAEPTRDQLSNAHAWVTLLGGIHAFTSDQISPKEKDTPTLERTEQVELSAYLSTLLLASTLGVSNGAEVVPDPEAAQRLFGPDVLNLHPSIQATWGHGTSHELWIDDFETDSTENRVGGINQAEPPGSAKRTFSWKPESNDPGRILGDSHALQLRGTPTSSFAIDLAPAGSGVPLTEHALLSFLIKDLEPSATLRVHVDTESGRLSQTVPPASSRFDSRRYRQVELSLGQSTPTYAQRLVIELNEGSVMIDDIRLIYP